MSSPVPPTESGARHKPATHLASTVSKKNTGARTLLGGVVLAAIIAAAFWQLNKASAGLNADKELADPQAATTSVPEAQRGNLTLDDSTKVLLGADSHIIVPVGFNKEKEVRAIRLVGTGSVTISPGKDTFDLRVGKAAIKGDNATVEVRADSAEPVVVRVRAGQAIAIVGKERRTLSEGQALYIDTTGAMRPATSAEVANGVGWTDGKFVADSEPLQVVVRELQRWYGLILFIKDKSLVDRPVTMSASLDSQGDALKALEKGGKLSFGYDPTGKNMELRDAGR